LKKKVSLVVPACFFLFVPCFNNLSPMYGTLVATEGMRLAEGVLSPLSLANNTSSKNGDNNSGRYAYAPKSPPRRVPSSACSSPSHAAQAHARSGGGGGRPRGVSFTSSASNVYSVTSKGKDKDKDSVSIANDFDQKAKKDKHSHHKGKGQLDSSSSAAGGGRYTPLERHSERDEEAAAAAAGKSEALQELIDVQNIAEVIMRAFFFFGSDINFNLVYHGWF
jgi:hypothetical protein